MLKYVLYREVDGTERAAFCLAPTSHLELATTLQLYRAGRVIVSAGFVEFVAGVARTHGYSDSLNLAPRDEDARWLTAFAKVTADSAAFAIRGQHAV